MTLTERGFTLIELMVVIGMIMLITAALSTAMTNATERARFRKAEADVKVISEAILAYENESTGGGRHELPSLDKADCDRDSLGFLLGRESSDTGKGKIPVLLQASLSGDGKMLDPWGHPYKVTIRKRSFTPKFQTMNGSLQTGFWLPNFYRLREGER